MTLDYLYRYNCQPDQVDHLLAAVALDSNRAIIAGYQALALVDLNALTQGGTTSYLHRITGLNARNLYLKDNYVFVNLHAMGATEVYGFAVVRIDGNTLTKIRTIGEANAFLEKMCISGDCLYVAAHNKGIRVYNISDPGNPVKIGSLASGFADAFDIAVSGNTAYVADGAGGLKIVDVTDPTHPVLTGGEDLATSVGTAEAVTVRNGKVYVAVGSAGLAVYNGSDLGSRQVVSTNGFAEDMCWIGDYLAVTTYPGLRVYDVSGAFPVLAASEAMNRRGSNGTLRICCGLGAADDGRIIVANWNHADVYQLKPDSQSSQPDINSTEQRIRFSPSAGTRVVTVTNNGQGSLQITGVTSSVASFTTDYSGGTLAAGQSAAFGITYNGSPTQGSGVVRIASNDPDENPLPTQVYGNTTYLDPGEPAIDFTLPILTRDPQTGQFTEESFTLSDCRGKVVWFNIFGSW